MTWESEGPHTLAHVPNLDHEDILVGPQDPILYFCLPNFMQSLQGVMIAWERCDSCSQVFVPAGFSSSFGVVGVIFLIA